MRSVTTLEDLLCDLDVDRWQPVVADLRLRGIGYALQNYREFARWLAVLNAIAPARGIEIGTLFGGTAALTLACIASLELLVTVDVEDREGVVAPLLHDHRHRLALVTGNSHDALTEVSVANALGGRPADFLFIDGDHSYEAVTADFARYGSLVREGGLIALHDIAAARFLGATQTAGVGAFWAELCDADPRNCSSFVEDFGIGIVLRRAAKNP